MTFAVAKLFWLLAEPPHLILLAFILGGVLWRTRWRRVGTRIACGGAVAYAAIVLLPLGTWLMTPLEGRFPPPNAPPERVDGVIVLGGAVEPRTSSTRHQTQLNDAAERMIALAELARRYPRARLVFTGGSGRLFDPGPREADHAKALFAALGIPPERVIYERDSRDTAENAVMTKALVLPKPDETWLLVTSAWHMPRAVGVFRHAGWRVTAWPVDYMTDGGVEWRIGPAGLDGMRRFTFGVREWVGLVAYRLLGRTDVLFPGP